MKGGGAKKRGPYIPGQGEEVEGAGVGRRTKVAGTAAVQVRNVTS